ncbi:Clp protease N-terminal domain-containing protein [Arthrobacter sp. 08Y14]|uniref:Clp protease N-terminal domain-containing protein n=1 Tax=Arthrobacter sp. 08Y14 TaxID=2058885 RepID=UPI000CE33162|nr:Clp protease N-terminal domain-containing protein [Arthrobacter sp. 08Y14]
MFERFTQDARTIVIEAQEQARKLEAREITADHLLLGILAGGDNPAARVLHQLGIESDAVAQRIQGLGAADAQALEAIGVDLYAVRKRVEASFGAGALDRPQRRRFRFPGRSSAGHIPFTASAKGALEHSLRQAIALNDKAITVEHILLGLIAEDSGLAARTIASLGVDPAQVRAAVLRERGKAA